MFQLLCLFLIWATLNPNHSPFLNSFLLFMEFKEAVISCAESVVSCLSESDFWVRKMFKIFLNKEKRMDCRYRDTVLYRIITSSPFVGSITAADTKSLMVQKLKEEGSQKKQVFLKLGVFSEYCVPPKFICWNSNPQLWWY